MTDKIIKCPTVARADYEWRKCCKVYEPIIKNVRKHPYTIELINGSKIIFKGETEGQRAILGCHADIHTIDSFADMEFMKAMGNRYRG